MPETGLSLPSGSVEDRVQHSLHKYHLVGQSPAIQDIRRQIAAVASAPNSRVLVIGETGTGKELVAGSIHYQSDRRNKPYIKVNCAALPQELLESILFGYEKGAFTGAYSRNNGKFQASNYGTLLLDEIGEIPSGIQAKILRVLEEGEVTRLGSNIPERVDVILIATTNRNIQDASSGFRRDLYYRLSAVEILVPPLRERAEDVPSLIEHFIHKHKSELGKPYVHGVSTQMVELFQAYSWPGNVRELENYIRHALITVDRNGPFVSKDERIHLDDTSSGYLDHMSFGRFMNAYNRERAHGVPIVMPSKPQELNYTLSLKEVVRDGGRNAARIAIKEALDKTGWNRVRAAKALRIGYRNLLYKMKDLGLRNPKGQHPPQDS